MKPIFPELAKTIQQISELPIAAHRKIILQELIEYVRAKHLQKEDIHLNFICTHNSRRSQFSQIWAFTAAYLCGVNAFCYSGGVEVTAFNERAMTSIRKSGFGISSNGTSNPVYKVTLNDQVQALNVFSKLYDHPINQTKSFAAVMTCSHADENCPFIPGTEKRISLQYEDPKAFDDSPQEGQKYDERSWQIASELFYVFRSIKA
jgi:arsenate reductase